ncbi:hypothetical protein ACFLXT_03335 [Chloroflexota bacterium]
MGAKLLTVEIPEELYDEFWGFAASKDGSYRSSKQTAQDSLESAVRTALREFLDKYKELYKQEPN